MPSNLGNPVRWSDRVRLILELRRADRRFAELLQRYRDDSPRIQAALIRTAREISSMNQALALVALESARTARVAGR